MTVAHETAPNCMSLWHCREPVARTAGRHCREARFFPAWELGQRYTFDLFVAFEYLKSRIPRQKFHVMTLESGADFFPIDLKFSAIIYTFAQVQKISSHWTLLSMQNVLTFGVLDALRQLSGRHRAAIDHVFRAV